MFPGHGGFLDRFDCILMLVPLVYFLHFKFVNPKINETAILRIFEGMGQTDQALILEKLKWMVLNK